MKKYFFSASTACVCMVVWGMFFATSKLLAIDLPFPGRFTQQFSHQIISIDTTSYYNNEGVVYELDFLEKDARERRVDEIFTFESRSAYIHPYFALMFDYGFFHREQRIFNTIGNEKKDESEIEISHRFSPSLFAILYPLRVGLSYHIDVGDNSLKQVQRITLRPAEAVSLHLQFFFDKIPKTALGIGGFYQFAFDPNLETAEILKQYYQKAGLSIHVYFAYYMHFRLLFSWERSEEDFSFNRRVAASAQDSDEVNPSEVNPSIERSIDLPQQTRYTLHYSFIYGFSEELSLVASIAQVVYANFESPDYRFKVGLNVSFGNNER